MANNTDFLNDVGRRPWDELFKRALRRPGVCAGILTDVLGCEFDFFIPNEIDWLHGHLSPRQRTWTTDLIGRIDSENIIHIEQQTANHGDMDIRMVEYGALIASNDRMVRNINQIYFSTDDSPVRNRAHLQVVDNKRRSIRSKYLFIDAGEIDSSAALKHHDFDVALFGFLARQIEDERSFASRMIGRALEEFDGQSLTDRLVDCLAMASEPPRLCRRPQLVRSRVYDKQDDKQVFS